MQRALHGSLRTVVTFVAALLTVSPVCAGTVAIPGQELTVPLATTLIALGFDTGNSTLYAITLGSGTTRQIGALNPSTGQFVNGTVHSVSILDFEPGFSLSVNPATSTIYVGEDRSIVAVSEATKQSEFYAEPSSWLDFRIDFLTNQIFGYSNQDIDSVSIPSGIETEITPLSNGYTATTGVLSAVDSVNHLFYVEESPKVGVNTLDMINERTGALTQFTLPNRLIGLTFDYSTNGLIGLTYNPYDLVRISFNGNSVVFSQIATLGGSFSASGMSALDPNDRYFFVQQGSSGQYLVTADIAAQRAWYVGIEGKDTANSLDSWLALAGQAMAARAASSPAGQLNYAILDFGDPVTVVKNGETLYGATGYSHSKRFLSTVDIIQGVLNYALGAHAQVANDPNVSLAIVVSTNNHGNSVTQTHGMAWAQMVSQIQSLLAQTGYSPQIIAVAGSDIELEYSPALVTQSWISGLGSSAWEDFGDALDCQLGNINCYSGWTIDQVTKVVGANAFPQIYNSGPQALNWQAVTKYSYDTYGKPIPIGGALSELTACTQTRNCKGLNNSPTTATMQLLSAVNQILGSNTAALPSSPLIEYRVP